MAKAATAEKIPARVSITPYLVVPEKGEPWLLGNRCPKCGATYLGKRLACSKCAYSGSFEEIKLSKKGKVYVFSVVYQSIPQIRAPYVSITVDLPEGVAVRGTLREIVPDPKNVPFDLEVEMFFESAGKDDNGSDVISYYFRPADPKKRVPRTPIMYSAAELAAMKAARKAAKSASPKAPAAKKARPAGKKPRAAKKAKPSKKKAAAKPKKKAAKKAKAKKARKK